MATGNWGCGAFRGNPQLKLLLQLMAAAMTGRDVCYFTFGDKDLVREGWALYQLFSSKEITVGHLFNIVISYSDNGVALFDYVTNQIHMETVQKPMRYHEEISAKEDKYNLETDEEDEVPSVAPEVSCPLGKPQKKVFFSGPATKRGEGH